MRAVQEALPLEELWASIDKHSQARQAVSATEQALADRAQQHRAVQKRLLMRFKDRQPSSLAHLDLLLEETFHQLLELGMSCTPCTSLTLLWVGETDWWGGWQVLAIWSVAGSHASLCFAAFEVALFIWVINPTNSRPVRRVSIGRSLTKFDLLQP